MTAASAKRDTPERSSARSRKAKDAAVIRKLSKINPVQPKATAPGVPVAPKRYFYEVKLIHKLNDWDAIVRYEADSAKTARAWATIKMAFPDSWLVVSAKRITPLKTVKVG